MFVLSGEYLNRYKKVKRVIKKHTCSSDKRTEALKDLYNIFVDLEMTGGSLDEFMNLRNYTTDIIATLPKKNKFYRWGILSGIGVILITTLIYLSLEIIEQQKYEILEAPAVLVQPSNTVVWAPIDDAYGYRIYVNGIYRYTTVRTDYRLSNLDYNTQYTIEVEAFSQNKYLKANKSVPVLLTTSNKHSQVYDFSESQMELTFDHIRRAHVLLAPNYSGRYKIIPANMTLHDFYITDITTDESVFMFRYEDHFEVSLKNDHIYELTVIQVFLTDGSLTITLEAASVRSDLTNVGTWLPQNEQTFFEYNNTSGTDQYIQIVSEGALTVRLYQGLEFENPGHYGVYLSNDIIKIDRTTSKIYFVVTNIDQSEASLQYFPLTDQVMSIGMNETIPLDQERDVFVFTHQITGATDIMITSGDITYYVNMYLYDGTWVQAIVHSPSPTETVFSIPDVYILSTITIVVFALPDVPSSGSGPSTITIQPST
jgi:hypothetical protein